MSRRDGGYLEGHRALIGTMLQGFWSAGAGLHEVFKNLVTSFELLLYLYTRIIVVVKFSLQIHATVRGHILVAL